MPSTFHDRLAELARLQGVSLYESGLAAGVSKGTVNQWVRKSQAGQGPNGRLTELLRMAEHYRVSLDWLTGRSDDGGPGAPSDPELRTRLPDALALARDAATALAFDLGLPLQQTWQAAFHARPYKADLDEYKKAILRHIGPDAAQEAARDDDNGAVDVPSGPHNVPKPPRKPRGPR